MLVSKTTLRKVLQMLFQSSYICLAWAESLEAWLHFIYLVTFQGGARGCIGPYDSHIEQESKIQVLLPAMLEGLILLRGSESSPFCHARGRQLLFGHN